MIENDILKTLNGMSIAAFNASKFVTQLGWTDKTHLKVLGRSFKPPSSACYLELFNIANGQSASYWDGDGVAQGNYRIMLHWVPDDKGVYTPGECLDDLISRLEIKSKVYYPTNDGAKLQIYNDPIPSGWIEGPSELIFHVSLPYRCYRP